MSKTTHYHFKRRIRELIEEGFTAPDIQKILEDETPNRLYDYIPTLRTIQRYVKKYGGQRGEEWKIDDCDNPEDAQIVFEALRALAAWTPIIRKPPKITKELADMVIRINRAAPALPPWVALKLASFYLWAEAQDDIHILLAFKPFENVHFYRAYVAYLKDLYGSAWKLHAFYKLVRRTYEDGQSETFEFWDFEPRDDFSPDKLLEDEDLQPLPEN